MRQRGRPRHPDVLTPREWEVLSLVREGLSNREIGDRLGVSRDGIKYHISQILPKLGVATREEAAAWQPATEAATAQPTALASRLLRVSRVGLIAAAGTLLAGLVALGGAVANSELSGGSASPSESADALGGGPPTSSPGESTIPTPSPDHPHAPPLQSDGALGSVAYVKDGNLWVLNLDTGENRMVVQRDIALTFGTTAQDLTMLSPEWSADGQWIAFGVRNGAVNNATSIWAVRASDGLLEGDGYGWYWEWSPTDLVLAGGFTGAGLSRPVGSFPAGHYQGMAPATGANVGQGEGRWSGDGRYVAVPDASGPRLDPQHSDNNSAPYQIKIVEPSVAGPAGPTLTPTDNSLGVKTIFTTNSGASAPVLHSWSPDGKYLLFWTRPASNTEGELTLLSLDDPSNVETLGNTPVMQSGAAWSPDGSLLAVGQISGPLRMCRPGEGFLYNLGGDGALDPSWSPDGSRIAFSKLGHITTAAADASDERALTNDASSEDRYPQYSQDGSRILFIRLNTESIASGIASPTELWLMNADGSDAHKVTDLPSVDTSSGGKGHYVDWRQYLSWYRPTGIVPFEAAPSPSIFPTGNTPNSFTPPPGVKPPVNTQPTPTVEG